jgi:hypothetical protein
MPKKKQPRVTYDRWGQPVYDQTAKANDKIISTVTSRAMEKAAQKTATVVDQVLTEFLNHPYGTGTKTDLAGFIRDRLEAQVDKLIFGALGFELRYGKLEIKSNSMVAKLIQAKAEKQISDLLKTQGWSLSKTQQKEILAEYRRSLDWEARKVARTMAESHAETIITNVINEAIGLPSDDQDKPKGK